MGLRIKWSVTWLIQLQRFLLRRSPSLDGSGKIAKSALIEFLVSPTTMELVLETKGLEGLESLDTKISRNWVLGRLHSIISLSI